MTAIDLMIGDWVLAEGKPVQVTNISVLGGDIIRVINPFMSYDIVYASNIVALSKGAKNINNIEPIPITEEILEKNGFDGDVYLWIDAGDGKTLVYYPFEHRLTLEYEDECGILFKCQCFSVHELQHALKLCGIEKDIIL